MERKELKLMVLLVFCFVLTACEAIEPSNTETGTPKQPTIIQQENETYTKDSPGIGVFEEKSDNFLKSIKDFRYENLKGGEAVNNYFSEINHTFEGMLGEYESIETLHLTAEHLLDGDSGFRIKISDSVAICDIYCRMVELTNEDSYRIDGAWGSLFLQYWTDERIEYTKLADSFSATSIATSFCDYRFIPEENAIIVLQQKYSDVVKEEHSYNLFYFEITSNGAHVLLPTDKEQFKSESWKICCEEFFLFDSESYISGLHIFEATDEDNFNKTSFEFEETALSIFNTVNREQSITIYLDEELWSLQKD